MPMLVDWNKENKYLAEEYGKGPFKVINQKINGEMFDHFEIYSPTHQVNYHFFMSRFDIIEDNQDLSDLL